MRMQFEKDRLKLAVEVGRKFVRVLCNNFDYFLRMFVLHLLVGFTCRNSVDSEEVVRVCIQWPLQKSKCTFHSVGKWWKYQIRRRC